MRLKMKCLVRGNPGQRPVPSRMIAAYFNLTPLVIGKGQTAALECSGDNRNFPRVKTHEIRAGGVHARWMQAEQNDASGDGIRVQRSPTLTGNDSIYQC